MAVTVGGAKSTERTPLSFHLATSATLQRDTALWLDFDHPKPPALNLNHNFSNAMNMVLRK
jgi:hypothetical protein